ncbi:MAG: T9SS type A sorting domain-containing protein, partial [Bacteroidales bacterium]|nr:T9SS type A sorting domain-containing protein [Bacteroidales bacterium]
AMKNIFTRILVVVGLVGGIINNIEAQISAEPVNDTICLGDDAEFIVVVNNSTDTSYQWQSFNGNNWLDLSNTGVYSGVDSDTLQLTSPSLTYNNSLYRCIVTQGSSNYTSDSAELIINEIPSPPTNVAAIPPAICEGGSSSLHATCSASTINWYEGSCGPQAPIGNGSPFVVSPTSTTTYYVSCENNCGESDCNSITVTVNEILPVSISIIAEPNDTICEGTEVTFTATPVNGGATPSYQWKLNENNVGTNSATYSSTTLSNNDEINCELTSSLPCTSNNPAISNNIEMTVYDLLLATIVNQDTTICFNVIPNTLYSDVSGGAINYTYQWESSTDGGTIWTPEGNDAELIFNDGLTTTTQYRLTVNDGGICGPVTTDVITITVYDELLASISSDQSICYNTAPDPLNSTVTGGDETYTYQWQDSPDGSAWTDISGATSETYQPPTLTATTHYQLIVDDETCSPVTSNSVTKTVYADLLASIGSDEIICFNTVPELLNSMVSGGDETYTYQWQDSPDGSSWADIPGATSDTYQPPALTAITYYQLIVDDETCTPVTTNSLTIIVYDQFDIGAISGGNTPICSGEDGGTLQANPTGGSESYTIDWYDGDDNYLASGITYPVGNLTETTSYYYHVLDSDNCGDENSQQVTILVNPSVTASISISVSKNPTCDNEVVIFSISDTLNGGNGPDFEWFLNGDSQSSGDSWTSIVSDNDEVYVQMNSNAECVSNNPADSDPITMTVNASPVLLNSGDLVPKPLDNPVVLICVDSTETNTYRWFENGVEIPSADEQFYYPRKYDLTFNYNSEYYVMIENDFCFSNSNPYIYAFDKSALFEESEVFIVYPNPNKGNFSLVLNEEIVQENFETGTIRILDVTGKIVFKEEFSEMEQNIELSGIQKGLYFLDVMISENQHQIRKLIIE